MAAVAEAGHQCYTLTTVHQDIESLAAAAVEMLLRRLDDPGARRGGILLPGTLIQRGSARLSGKP